MLKASLRVTNAHYQLRCNHPIDLQHLSDLVGRNGKLYRGRPTMLTCHIMTKRVQFFPNGTIQTLGGGVTPFHLYHLRKKVLQLLKLTILNLPVRQPIQLSPWIVNNCVYEFDFKRRFKFEKISCDKDFSYEPELFPAALISKWTPVHITLFSNGKGLVTGVKTETEAMSYLQQLTFFLSCKA